jgi:glycosyltransferase involved in cell wall biosynthesis
MSGSSSPTTPLVTVVTPSYNQAQFLEHTIQSVLAQDYPDIEYLIVDGGSTDGSLEVIRRYAHRLAWWVSEPDHGQAEAINKGLCRAQGEIVAWLNSDDLYLPGAISQAVQAMRSDPSLGLVFGDAITINAQGQPLNCLSFGQWGLPELARFRIICQPAVFMRRTVVERAAQPLKGQYLDLSFHYVLDHHLWLRLARLAPIRHVPALWAAARHHPGAKNVAQAAAFSAEIWRVLEWMEAQPDFAPLLEQNRRQIEGGAYRLQGRYLLDGGQPGLALQAYGRALRSWPSYALRHWHRMIYALLCLAGAGGLADQFYEWRTHLPAASGRIPDLSSIPGINSWPGISPSAGLRHR